MDISERRKDNQLYRSDKTGRKKDKAISMKEIERIECSDDYNDRLESSEFIESERRIEEELERLDKGE